MPSKVWDEIIQQIPKFNGSSVVVWQWISIFIPQLMTDAITYPYLCYDTTNYFTVTIDIPELAGELWDVHQGPDIQIKICAEYRDMLPRPRLVCQEPGLRPIGRSPGVPDKSSRGLGSMSRYSAQILICFIAYIFLIFIHSSVGLVGNFAGLPVCTVPSAIVHCNQNEAGHQTIKAPSMPCWDAAGPSKHSLAFSHSLVKMTDKMDEMCINRKFSAQEPSEWRDFVIPVSNFTVFQPRI